MTSPKSFFASIVSLHMVMDVMASITITLRFNARRITEAPLKMDDWLAVAAALFMWGNSICTILEFRPNLRTRAQDEMPVSIQNEVMVISFISIVCTTLTEVIARLSVIFLYYRLFSVKKLFSHALIVNGVLSILWLFIVVFSAAFECKPVRANFDASIHGECLNTQVGFFVSEIINLGLDLSLVCMPVPIIWNLHLPTRERVGLMGIFLTGGIVLITSILRLVEGYKPHGNTNVASVTHLEIWTGLHLGFAIICSCLPVFRIYLPKTGSMGSSLRHPYSYISRLIPGQRSTNSASSPSVPSVVRRVDTGFLSSTRVTKQDVDEVPLTNITIEYIPERY